MQLLEHLEELSFKQEGLLTANSGGALETLPGTSKGSGCSGGHGAAEMSGTGKGESAGSWYALAENGRAPARGGAQGAWR